MDHHRLGVLLQFCQPPPVLPPVIAPLGRRADRVPQNMEPESNALELTGVVVHTLEARPHELGQGLPNLLAVFREQGRAQDLRVGGGPGYAVRGGEGL